jgi:hypothetical protein
MAPSGVTRAELYEGRMKNKRTQTMIPPTEYGIRYIGNRAEHIDNLYGTNLIWVPGQVHNVAKKTADLMLLHADVYEIAEVIKGEPTAHVDDKEIVNVPVLLPNLEGIDATSLKDYAIQHYGEKLAHNMKPENMRAKIVSLIGARGAK